MLRVATILDRNSKSPSPLNQGKSRARERWNAPLSYPWLWGEAGCEFSVYFTQDCCLFYSKVVEYHQPHYQGSHYPSLTPSDQSKRTLGTRFGYRASNASDEGQDFSLPARITTYPLKGENWLRENPTIYKRAPWKIEIQAPVVQRWITLSTE